MTNVGDEIFIRQTLLNVNYRINRYLNQRLILMITERGASMLEVLKLNQCGVKSLLRWGH